MCIKHVLEFLSNFDQNKTKEAVGFIDIAVKVA